MQAALAGIEKKRQQAAQMAHWADELAAGRCPPEMQAQIYKLLFKPDKNGPEYKALVQAGLGSKAAPPDLLGRAGQMLALARPADGLLAQTLELPSCRFMLEPRP